MGNDSAEYWLGIDPAFPASESILVQGVVDAWFMEGDQIILVDYKTDYVASGQKDELVRKYRAQLLTYADALQRLTGMSRHCLLPGM